MYTRHPKPLRFRQSVHPVRSYRRMINELAHREDSRGTDIPITVGILIADFRRNFCRENICSQIERLNRKSGPLIDFYIPGYIRTILEDSESDCLCFKDAGYRFSRHDFDEFIYKLEDRGIKVTGHAQLLLIPYEKKRLWFRDAISFDLEKDESSGKIESTKLFFDFIFEISKSTTDFEEFRKKINFERTRVAVIEFVKEQLLSSLWSLLTSPFYK